MKLDPMIKHVEDVLLTELKMQRAFIGLSRKALTRDFKTNEKVDTRMA